MDVLETDTAPEARRSRTALLVGLVLVVALGIWLGWRAGHPPVGTSSAAPTSATVTSTPRPIVLLPGPTPIETPRPVPSIPPALAQRAMTALLQQAPTADTTSFVVVAGYPYAAVGALSELDIASAAGTRVVHFLCLGTGAVVVNIKSDLRLTVACTTDPGRNASATISTTVDTIYLTYECREGTLGALAFVVSRS
jgi:hypothetical protein